MIELILVFMSGSPWLTFCLIFIFLCSIDELYKKTIRGLNIRKHGWPPLNCDADGDFRGEE